MDVDEGQRAAIAGRGEGDLWRGSSVRGESSRSCGAGNNSRAGGESGEGLEELGTGPRQSRPQVSTEGAQGRLGRKGILAFLGLGKEKGPLAREGGSSPAGSGDPVSHPGYDEAHFETRKRAVAPETGDILFIDTAPYSRLDSLKLAATKWQELYVANKVTCSLRLALMLRLIQTLRAKLEELLRDDALLQRYKNCGWISDGANAFTPMWHYFEWNPKEKREFQASTPPLSHSIIMATLDEMEQALPEYGVLLKFKSTKPITDDIPQDVLPFLITVGLRSENAHKVFQGLRHLSGNAVMKVLGGRLRPERGQRQPLAKQVEDAYKGTSYCEWNRSQTWEKK